MHAVKGSRSPFHQQGIHTDSCYWYSLPLSALQIHPFDHTTKQNNAHEPALLIYVDILSAEFPALYRQLLNSQSTTEPCIVLRWKPTSQNLPNSKLVLSGYGVGLDLKRVDYITIDDRDMPQDAESAKEEKAIKKEQTSSLETSETDDVFAQADARPAELVQLKPEQLQGELELLCSIDGKH